MNWLELLLGSATGGGLLGFIGALGKGWLEIKQERVRIEGRKAEAEIQRELIKLNIDKTTIENEGAAFNKALEASKEDAVSDEAWKKVRTPSQVWLLLIVDCLRSGTRPMLTWATLGVAVFLFITGDVQTKALIAAGLSAMPGTALGFWFGSRPVFRFSK